MRGTNGNQFLTIAESLFLNFSSTGLAAQLSFSVADLNMVAPQTIQQDWDIREN